MSIVLMSKKKLKLKKKKIFNLLLRSSADPCVNVPSLLTLGILRRPLSQHSLSPSRHQRLLLISSSHTTNQEETKNTERRSSSQQIVSYCLGLHTQNPGLRGED